MSVLNFIQPVPPDVAIAIEASHIRAARLAWRGAVPTVASQAVEALPPGAVVPSLASPSIADVPLVSRVLTDALNRLGGRVSRAALVIPDTAAKVSLVRFETVPERAADLAELIRWQVRKTAPFPIEQAIVSYTPGGKPAEGGHEFVVTVARAEGVQQFEDVCARAGVHAGLVDIASFSVINSVLASQAAPGGDWLLVHAADTYTTLAVLRGADVIFYRNREDETGAVLGDIVHQTTMYYEDRLQGAGFARVLLSGSAVGAADDVRRSLEHRLDIRLEPVAQAEVAPLIGILARERKAA